jgi:hypothetical protein
MIRECQDKLFSNYRASQTANSGGINETPASSAPSPRNEEKYNVAETTGSMDTISEIYTPLRTNKSHNSNRDTTFAYHDALTQIASHDVPAQGRKRTDQDSGYEDDLSLHTSTLNSTSVHPLDLADQIPKYEDPPYSPRSHIPHGTQTVQNDDTSYFVDDLARYDVNQQFPGDMFSTDGTGGFVDGQNLWGWEFDGGGEFGGTVRF